MRKFFYYFRKQSELGFYSENGNLLPNCYLTVYKKIIIGMSQVILFIATYLENMIVYVACAVISTYENFMLKDFL